MSFARGHIWIVLVHPIGERAYVRAVYANVYAANADAELWMARHDGALAETVALWIVNGGV